MSDDEFPTKSWSIKSKTCSKCYLKRQMSSSSYEQLNKNDIRQSTFVNILYSTNSFGRFPLFRDFRYSFINSTTFRHFYHDVRNDVLNSDRVHEGIFKAVSQHINIFEKQSEYARASEQHTSRAATIFAKMCAHVNRFIVNITAWVLLKTLRRIFHSVEVDCHKMDRIKKASEENLPIVFLPNHRSHLDYILLTFAVWQWDIRVPHVAAGENLNLPFFGYVLRCLGAFFIKRRLDFLDGQKDYVYRSVLHSYMTEILKSGENVEFFIEAGRSRTGKAIIPKAGISSDCFIVPVSISYEKIVDGGFLSELGGSSKKPETFWGTVKGIWQVFHSHFGTVRIDFAEPTKLKELLTSMSDNVVSKQVFQKDCLLSSPSLSSIGSQNYMKSRTSTSSLCKSDDHTRNMVKALCHHVVCDFTDNCVQMCTHVLSFVLLNKYCSNGGIFRDVVDDFRWLTSEILKRGRSVGFFGDASDSVRCALSLLGSSLVTFEVSDNDSGVEMRLSQCEFDSWLVKPSNRLEDVLHLAFYKNSVVSIFLLESIVSNAILTLLPELADQRNLCLSFTASFNYSHLLRRCFSLCDLLRMEFLFCSPCISLEDALQEAMNSMIESGVIQRKFVENEENSANVVKSGNVRKDSSEKFYVPQATDSDNESGEEELFDKTAFRYDRGDSVKSNLQLGSNLGSLYFYANALSPFLHSYCFLIENLRCLQKNRMKEAEFLKYVFAKAKELIDTSNGNLYVEFANSEYFRNALQWCLEKQVLRIEVDENGGRFVTLNCERDQEEVKLTRFVESVKKLCTLLYVA